MIVQIPIRILIQIEQVQPQVPHVKAPPQVQVQEQTDLQIQVQAPFPGNITVYGNHRKYDGSPL